jgi:hypothetical protein
MKDLQTVPEPGTAFAVSADLVAYTQLPDAVPNVTSELDVLGYLKRPDLSSAGEIIAA